MKKQKLLVGLCLPAALVGTTAGVFGVIYSLNKNNKPIVERTKGDYTVTFDPGNGRIIENADYATQHVYWNETLDRLPQPTVRSNKASAGYNFCGWFDGDVEVTGTHKFTKNTNLVAKYANGETAGYHTVTFLSDDPTVTFIGNRTVSVLDGYNFYRVNRPVAQGASNQWFKQWVDYDSGKVITEDTVINKDMKLRPQFTQGVTITWNVRESEGGQVARGSDKTTLEQGTVFSKFNQPEIFNNYTNKFFAGWEDADGNLISKSTAINTDTTVYARWEGSPSVSEGYATLAYVQNDTAGQPSGMTFSPSSFGIVKTTGEEGTWEPTKWSEREGLVTPSCAGGHFKVDVDGEGHEIWEVRMENPETQGQYTEWQAITQEFTFNQKWSGTDKLIKKYELRPTMISKITGVTIAESARNTLLPEWESPAYVTNVSGDTEAGSQQVTWKIYKDNNGVIGDEISQTPTETYTPPIYFDANSKLHTEFHSENTKYWIKAFSKINPSKESDAKQIQVVMPYAWDDTTVTEGIAYNQLIWFIQTEVRESTTTKHWCWINPADLCEDKQKAFNYHVFYSDETVAVQKKMGETQVDPNFNSNLIIGHGINNIPYNFCALFPNFGGQITLHEGITNISTGFMMGCSNFTNKGQPLAIPTTVKKIGDQFLYGCAKFNQAIDLSGLGELYYIGEDFLGGCKMLNSEVTLPTTANLTIGQGFLYNCWLFNQNITIPSNVVSVSSNFMNNCCSFTSTLTIDASIDAFTLDPKNMSACRTTFVDPTDGLTKQCPIYETGFKYAGSSEDKFYEEYGNAAADNAYRTVNKEAPAPVGNATKWNAAIAEIFTTDSPNYRVAKSYDYYTTDPMGMTPYQEDETYSVWTDTSAATKHPSYKNVLGGTTQFMIYDDTLGCYIDVDESGNMLGVTSSENFIKVMKEEIYDEYLFENIGTTEVPAHRIDYAQCQGSFDPVTGYYNLTEKDLQDEDGNVIGTLRANLKFTKDSDDNYHIRSIRMITETDGINPMGDPYTTTRTTDYAFSNIGKENYTGPKSISEVGRREIATGTNADYSTYNETTKKLVDIENSLSVCTQLNGTIAKGTLNVKVTPSSLTKEKAPDTLGCTLCVISSDGSVKAQTGQQEMTLVDDYYYYDFNLVDILQSQGLNLENTDKLCVWFDVEKDGYSSFTFEDLKIDLRLENAA